jgi:hypothetical protein
LAKKKKQKQGKVINEESERFSVYSDYLDSNLASAGLDLSDPLTSAIYSTATKHLKPPPGWMIKISEEYNTAELIKQLASDISSRVKTDKKFFSSGAHYDTFFKNFPALYETHQFKMSANNLLSTVNLTLEQLEDLSDSNMDDWPDDSEGSSLEKMRYGQANVFLETAWNEIKRAFLSEYGYQDNADPIDLKKRLLLNLPDDAPFAMENTGEETSAINDIESETGSSADDAIDAMMQSKSGAGVAGAGVAETSKLEVEPTLETLPEETEPTVEETTEETVTEPTEETVTEGPINPPVEVTEQASVGLDTDDAIDSMMQSKTGAGVAGAGEETTEETEESAGGALSVVNNISNVTSSGDTTVGGETTNIEETTVGGETASVEDTAAAPTPESTSPINEEEKEKTGGFGKFLTASLGVTKSPTFGNIMGQLQGGNILGAAGNTINSIKNLFAKRKKKKQDRQIAIEAYSAIEKNKLAESGIETPEIEGAAETAEPILESVSSLETPSVSSLVPPPPVTKKDMEAVGQNISSTISNTSISNLPATAGANISAPAEGSTGTEDSQKGGGGTTVSTGSSNLDTSALEKRLKNIELLLQGPLTVKLQR